MDIKTEFTFYPDYENNLELPEKQRLAVVYVKPRYGWAQEIKETEDNPSSREYTFAFARLHTKRFVNLNINGKKVETVDKLLDVCQEQELVDCLINGPHKKYFDELSDKLKNLEGQSDSSTTPTVTNSTAPIASETKTTLIPQDTGTAA